MGLTIKELIPIGEKILKDGGVTENAPHDAEALLGFELGFDKQKIFMNWTYEPDASHIESYFDLANRRAAGEPLQYITGEQYFMGHRFVVNPSVLIPRPETEVLAEKVISLLNESIKAKNVLDLCTGSGALAISIAKACPRLKITATDISEEALAVARQNASALSAAGRINFVQSDLFEEIKTGIFGKKFDLVAVNPPYIKSADIFSLPREIKEHEPELALDGGEDGLAFYRRIAEAIPPYLKANARLITEIGLGQAQDVSSIFESVGFGNTKLIKDLTGTDRILSFVFL